MGFEEGKIMLRSKILSSNSNPDPVIGQMRQDTSTDVLSPLEYWMNRLLHYHPILPVYLRDLLSTVVAHVPRVIAQRMIESPNPQPMAISLEGTVMFADIVGFSPLAERFSRAASEDGAEELTDLVNRFLEILIPITARYGGDLQKFGGDAGMLLFQGEDHALRAVAASLEVQSAMQSKMREVETSLGCFPLRIAIGLGTGPMIGLGLGDQEGREWLLMGPPLISMGRAQSAAPPDGTVVDANTLAACGEAVKYTNVSDALYKVLALSRAPLPYDDAAILDPPKVAAVLRMRWMLSRLDALAPYLVPGLLERLITAPDLERLSVWSDLRQVTVMMLSLSTDVDLMPFWGDDDRLMEEVQTLNTLFIRMRDTVLRYDGTVNKIGMSPQGAFVMVLFGAPRAHEDDPLRAVLAALELQEAFDFSLRFGINTGYVFAGDVGTSERREYTVMGDEVNLAHRLMSGCEPGEIWLGPNTYHHAVVRRRIVGGFAGPHKFKGKQDPINPFIARGLRRTQLDTTASELPIIGRDDALAQLSDVLQEVKTGSSRVVLLHGRAGVGKSYLAQAFAEIAKQRGFAVHMGSAPSYGSHLPFAAWEGALLSLFELEFIPSDERQASLYLGLESYGLETWGALLAPLVGIELSPSSEVLALPSDMREIRRQGALRELWEKATRQQPRLLILENVHWMPAPSLELLDGLLEVEIAAPLLILITYRDELPVADRWVNIQGGVDYPLSVLTPDAMQTLVQRLFEEVPLPAEVRQWVVKRSRGLPLFATEAVRALIDSGVLHRHNGSWALNGSLEDFPLPDMMYGLIQSRIDQLPPPGRHLLRAAAVIGDEMTLPILAAAYGEETESAVRRRVSQLEPFGLVPRAPSDEVLVFHQPLVREVAYRGLPQRVKRLVHQRLTEYLDYTREEAMPNWLNLLAYHAFEGHLWEKAIDANLELGARALQAYLATQALVAFQRVLKAADDGGLVATNARFEAHYRLGETLTMLGQYEEALRHLDEARHMLPAEPMESEDVARFANLEYHRATVFEAMGAYARALEVVEHGLSLPGVERTLGGAKLYLIGADLFRRQNAYQQARAWAQRSVALSARFPGQDSQYIRSRAMYMLALLASLQRMGM
jgi:class 3 adenylate cyclase